MSFPIAIPGFVHPDKAQKGKDDLIIISESSNGEYYLMQYNSGPDNRFNSTFIDAILEALDYLRFKGEAKVLVTTSAFPKFFSNGLDFKHAITTTGFFEDKFFRMMRTYMEFPYPTVALIPGHAFAGGFMIAACHDYRVQNPDKGFLCLNEVTFNSEFLAPMLSIFKVKFGTPMVFKSAIQAHRWTGKEALANGIVDVLGGLPECEELISKVAGKYVKVGAYPGIRTEILKEVIADTLNHREDTVRKDGYRSFASTYYDQRESALDLKLEKLSKL